MKRIVLSAAVLLLVSSSFASDPPEINEKILESFKKTFTEMEAVKWYENETTFEARFSLDGIKTIVWYSKDGDLVLTHRNYEANKLPPFVLTKIREELPAYSILGVTEISNKNGVNYYITLEGEKNWMKIKADPHGEYEVYEKFKKAKLPF